MVFNREIDRTPANPDRLFTVDYAAQSRSRRVVRTIPLTISSVTNDGHVIEGAAETLVLSKHGARIHTNCTFVSWRSRKDHRFRHRTPGGGNSDLGLARIALRIWD